ncbi:FAD-binding protein [Arthrobacter sp. zg-Y820]|uniref:FAD-binding protein n=1 Tax=unclassified Arthrobacter TaxID=235627 RepID=UPI001E46CA73|nr:MULTISPECIES: FAD-binding protein [unclassified Arthrobacter]MCC9196744.1 FAD-binding protein [Arthrobacter sp. zg-Y820]MDK1279606.1 FAD-binding protein [Arthrobacter sp. zg.Y820]WIB11127.1 FAD-binding protein [Arthrobacter sp. zg-Y820]
MAQPSSVDELRVLVAAASAVRPVGTRHSFNGIADSSGIMVNLDRLEGLPVLDEQARTVTVSAGTRYGDLAAFLVRHGYALHNLASLPHISVAGAVATATHGSGNGNGNLATAVAALELVTADGSLVRADRSSPDFNGMVVSLGALGIFTGITLDIEPAYEVRQDVFTNVPWASVEENFDAVTSAAYSVSIFSSLTGPAASQVWLKSRTDTDLPYAGAAEFFGGTAAEEPMHPLPGISAVNCSQQMGVPGSWSDRLAHFRLAFTPSNGDELQSEYLVPRSSAVEAIRVLRGLSAKIAPLLQVCEIRTIARDDLWLSNSYGQETVAFHFTWKPRQADVEELLPHMEAALAPLRARPHWGKLFALEQAQLQELYPRFADFRNLAHNMDPEGKFRNAFLARHVLG